MDGTCYTFAVWNGMRAVIMSPSLDWITIPGGKNHPSSYVGNTKSKCQWDIVFKLVLLILMGNDSHCSLDITVIYWCDCECTLYLGISVCFLFSTDILLTTPPLSVHEPAAWLVYRTTVTVYRLLNQDTCYNAGLHLPLFLGYLSTIAYNVMSAFSFRAGYHFITILVMNTCVLVTKLNQYFFQ